MLRSQPGILATLPRLSRYLVFSLTSMNDASPVLQSLVKEFKGDDSVVGLGLPLLAALKKSIDGLSVFPACAGPGIEVPSSPFALWCWLRGEDRGELYHRTRALQKILAPAFELKNTIDGFQYGPSLDLSGYVDGTENPKGNDAVNVGIVSGKGKGMDGSSFVAVQQWVHDLDKLQKLPQKDQDNIFGRRKSDNAELSDAPKSAHVKRTAQESFDPEAFILRRSMPWADAHQAGLVFVAFGKSFDAYETLLNQMIGANDGIVDGLFRFTRPISGSYYWCPPISDAKTLDLSVLGL